MIIRSFPPCPGCWYLTASHVSLWGRVHFRFAQQKSMVNTGDLSLQAPRTFCLFEQDLGPGGTSGDISQRLVHFILTLRQQNGCDRSV